MDRQKVVIIGAGPAGISSAIQLKRYGINFLIFEKNKIGGLLKNANLVENYPGFPKGITGYRLIDLFKEQLNRSGIKINFKEVSKLDYKNKKFLVKIGNQILSCDTVIIASGTKPHKLTTPRVTEDIKKHIFYEIYPLGNIRNKKIAIIGAGDCAFDYALNLAKKNRVTILNRGKNIKCLPMLWQRIMNSKRISYHKNIEIKNIELNKDGLILTCDDSAGISKIHTHYLGLAIGREPYLDFLSANLKKNLKKLQKRKILYMIGDVKNKNCRQVAIAVGEGIKTAMEIYKNLKQKAL